MRLLPMPILIGVHGFLAGLLKLRRIGHQPGTGVGHAIVEIGAELVQAGLQLLAQAIPFGHADLADPAALENRQHRAEYREQPGGHP